MFICRLYLNYPTHICRCKTFFLPLAVIRRHKRCVASRQKKDVSPTLFPYTMFICRLYLNYPTYSMSPYLLSSDKYMSPLIFSDDVYMSSLFQLATHICRRKSFFSPTPSYQATQEMCRLTTKKRCVAF